VKALNATDQVIEADPKLITDTYAYAGPGLLLYRYGTIRSNKDLQSIVRTDTGDPEADAIVSSSIDASTGETESIAWLTISADRQSLIHTCGRVLVCRRSRDLSVLWSRELDHSFRIRRTGISATGAFAAVGMIEGGRISGRSRRAAVEVLDGRDGSLVRRIDVDGTASVAVSDDGRIVAAGTELERTPRFGRIQTIVRLLDVSTGRELQMLVHTEMSTEKRLESGLRFDGLQFTPDDRYLFSVGESTRIWKLERGNRCG
jgi:hypothetical protein